MTAGKQSGLGDNFYIGGYDLSGDVSALTQIGAGKVSTSAGSGATQHSPHSYTGTAAQYTQISILVTANSGGTSAVYSLLGDGA